jgi:hypothetical protein
MAESSTESVTKTSDLLADIDAVVLIVSLQLAKLFTS